MKFDSSAKIAEEK